MLLPEVCFIKITLSINYSIDNFGRRELEKHGWRFGHSIHGQKDMTHVGLRNPVHVKGFSTGGWMNTTQDSTFEGEMGEWSATDEHYPSKQGLIKRPGLGSDPAMNLFTPNDRMTFDITTRSDQSKSHQPEPGKIIMADGSAYYPEELKKLRCLNQPTCQSQRRHSLQSRQNLCDVCARKKRYCQSGSARTRRTERRREARLEQTMQSSSQLRSPDQEIFQPTPTASSGRLIQATKRSSWRRPCLKNIETILLGDSQVIPQLIQHILKFFQG